MKKIIVLLYLFLPFTYAFSQSWVSSSIIQSDGDITVINSSQDNQNNTFLLGYYDGAEISGSGFSATSFGGRDYFVSKFNTDGNLEWIKSIGGTLNDDIDGGIYVDNDNNIYVTGGFQNYLKYSPIDSIASTGDFDIFLLRFDQDGNVDWIVTPGLGFNLQKSTSLSIADDGNIVLAGYYKDSISFYTDTTLYAENTSTHFFYANFSSNDGSLIWAKGLKVLSGPIGGRIYDITISSGHYGFSGMFFGSVVFGNDTINSISNSIDAFFFKTNLEGDIQFTRTIRGSGHNWSYKSIEDEENNIYFTGYYASTELVIDSTETDDYLYNGNSGNFDFFISKYNSIGDLQWFKTAGGPGIDKIADAAFFNNEINVSGLFTDTLNWGGIKLSASSATDQDMFIGALSVDGNFRSANSFAGRNNSVEDARSIFSEGENLYTVIRSNSDLLVLGDDIYTNQSLKYFVAVGKIGCLPLSVTPNPVDVIGCNGDATGSIFVSAAGGFGSPFQYSIDNGLNYQENDPNFAGLAAGDYDVVVIDNKNCAQEGGTVTIAEPDVLDMTLVSSADITDLAPGEIVVEAVGGTPPFIYTLQPTGTQQLNGTFTFEAGEGGDYTVEVQDAHDCGPAVTQSVTIADLTNVSDLQLYEGSVYPNPSTGMITIEFATDRAEMLLQIYSSEGRRVMSKTVYSAGGKVNETMDLSNLDKGLYMIRIDEKTLSSGVVLN